MDESALATVSAIKVIPPLEAVAHFNPVASELSATNLIQEQSQRIVLGTIANDCA